MISRIVVAAVVTATAAPALAIVGPLAFGDRPYTALTDSMEPTISAGDVVIDERISPLQAQVGDVVTFRDPEDQSRQLTHRVKSIRRQGSHGTASTMTMSGNTVTVVLGTYNATAIVDPARTTAGGRGTMAWTPVATPFDRAANSMSTTAANESGAADRDF